MSRKTNQDEKAANACRACGNRPRLPPAGLLLMSRLRRKQEDFEMTLRLDRAIAALALIAACSPALAQQPTQAQIDAIRSNCRSDFLSKCSGVPRGGPEA